MQENDLAIINTNNMESQEAKLYRGKKGKEYVKSLCLLGNNDDFDEIVVEVDN